MKTIIQTGWLREQKKQYNEIYYIRIEWNDR
jgi:hypothetical protein